MAVSGKTAAPSEIPYLIGSDIPDMSAGDKAIAERVSAILEAENRQPLKWLQKGTKKQLIVCNSSGVPQYVTMKGDGTIDEEGNLQLGAGVVGTNELADQAVTSRKTKLTSGVVRNVGKVTLVESGTTVVVDLKVKPDVASILLVVASLQITSPPAGDFGFAELLLDGDLLHTAGLSGASDEPPIYTGLAACPLEAGIEHTVRLQQIKPAKVAGGHVTANTGGQLLYLLTAA